MAKHTVRRKDSDEDVFVAKTVEASVWARQHTNLITGIVVALALVIAGGIYYKNYRAKLQDRAAAELGTIRQTAGSGNRALAVKDLETFIKKFDGTPAEKEARILLGQAYLEMNQAPKAITTVKPLADDLDEALGPSAGLLLAAAYEKSNQLKNAENTYLKIGDDSRFAFQRRDAIEAAARLRAEHNDIAGATQLYERLVQMTPDSVPQHQLYQMRLAELKARPAASAKS